MKNIKQEKRIRRHTRIRAKVAGTSTTPRLSIFKSNNYMYAQLINDDEGVTLAAVNSLKAKGKNGVEKAHAVGVEIAKKAIEKKIEKVIFDRGGFIYTGQVKAVAEGAREGGLKF